MKNRYIKLSLLSITLVSSLIFTACNKTEEAVTTGAEIESTTEETVEEVVEDTIEEAEKEAEATVEAENTDSSTIHVDSTGDDITLEEGDYIEPSVEEIEAEKAAEEASKSSYSATTQQGINNLKNMYEMGLFTEDEYNELVESVIRAGENESNGGGSGSSGSTYTQQTLTPEQQAAVDAMRTDTLPPTDNRTNIQYGQGDYSGLEHYRIN